MRHLTLAAALLLAAPLAAQQTSTTTLVAPVEITVNGDTIVVNVEVMSDSVRLARIADAMEALAAAIEECACGEPPGTSTLVVRYGVPAVAIIFGILGLRQLSRIADGLDKDHHPEPEETEDDDHDSESG